jgi:hypothetical protein
MIGDFFYFFGLIVFILDLNLLFEFFEYIKLKEWAESFKKVTKKEPIEKDFKKGNFTSNIIKTDLNSDYLKFVYYFCFLKQKNEQSN